MIKQKMRSRLEANAETLGEDFVWMQRVLAARMEGHMQSNGQAVSIYDIDPPLLAPESSTYGSFISHYEMGFEERFVVLLALAPHIRPEILDVFYTPNARWGRGHTEFGGIQGQTHGGFLPTGETALFVLSEGDLGRRFACERLFDRDHFFALHDLLKLEAPPVGEPAYSGRLLMSSEIIDFLTTGELRKPDFSREFPARRLQTEMDWSDLVLASVTREQLRELIAWIEYRSVVMDAWELNRRLRPGYKCLFYGPPGTGKTLTATLLGKRMGMDVYRIDLSTVVSKYIGETEKNLERVFERARNMNCILFFDEADALFGKRTGVSDAHDRYANQEVSYLLQRIEEFAGLVILATNFQSNLDDAFTRRFQAVVHFPMPGITERRALWESSFSEHSVLGKGLDLDDIARRYELSGGAIMNVIRYASLMAASAETNEIQESDVIDGVRRELQKEGKTL